jgi:hypothetical protein
MLISRTRYPEYRAIALLELGAIAGPVLDPCALLATANGQSAAASRTTRLRIKFQLEVIGLV